MRGVATAVAAALLALAAPVAAHAAGELRVEPEGAAPVALDLAALGEPDVRERRYRVAGAAGEQPLTVTGYTLDRVLRAAHVDPYDYGALAVVSGEGSLALGRDDVTDPDRFEDGPPVFYVEDGSGRFVLPGRDGAPGQLSGAGPLTVTLARSTRLELSVVASRRKLKRGRRVTFTATVRGASGDEPVSISWYFDDGRSARGSRVTHRFRRAGTYDVVVGATTAPGDPGADATVTVRVGKPPAGPDRKGGGTNADEDAPDSGAGTGPDGAGDGDGSGDGAQAPGAADSGQATDSGAKAGSAAQRRKARARRAREAQRARAAREAKRAARDARRREAGRAGDAAAERPVEGIELAGLDGLSTAAGRDAVRAAARRGRPQDERPGPGIPPELWWALAGAGLLVAGGWREARPRARAL